MHRKPRPLTLLQAAEASPTLAQLAARASDSMARLRDIESLIPPALRAAIRPGPIDASQWCLLLDNSAAAAKMRQLLPALEAHLRNKGWETRAIRLKVHDPRSR